MTEQDKKFKEYWEKVKAGGRWKYMFIKGGLFGIGVFIFLNLFHLKDMSFAEIYGTRKAFEQMLTMVFAGILGYGTFKWWINERTYKQIIESEPSNQQEKAK